MKVVSLYAENVKRLKAVHVVPDPDGNLVIVAGRNAQGKTSVLDSIWLALGGGTAGRETAKPIREGQDRAVVTLDLGDLKVTRSWQGDKTTLRVENADGARYSSPQTMLDALVGRLSFDPLAFAQQDEKSQRATLLSLIDLPFDPTELDAQRRRVFEDRTDVNRELKQLEAQVAAIPTPDEDVPAEEISLADLLEQQRVARRHQDRAQQIREDHALHQGNLDRAKAAAEAAEQAVAAAEQDLRDSAAALAGIPEDLPDPTVYDEQLLKLEATNRAVREAQQRDRLVAHVGEVTNRSALLTETLQEIDAQRERALSEAKFPIDGLGFDEDGVTYQDVPFKQASAAEQLRVSVAMAMALNPKVRVIRITDGSLLDSTNLALIEQMAGEHEFQVWIERVDESGATGVVIEDGQVVGADAMAEAVAG